MTKTELENKILSLNTRAEIARNHFKTHCEKVRKQEIVLLDTLGRLVHERNILSNLLELGDYEKED